MVGAIISICVGILFTVLASITFASMSKKSDDFFDFGFVMSFLAIIFYILGGYLLYDYSKEESIKAYMNGEYVIDTLNVTQKGVITEIKVNDYKVK